MKRLILLLMCLPALMPAPAQKINVSGTAKMNIVPDEVHLLVTLKEYYLIDADGRRYVDYRDRSSVSFDIGLFESLGPDQIFEFKVDGNPVSILRGKVTRSLVSLATLEDRLIRSAHKVGIDSKDITISTLGDTWRWHNSEYLLSKQYDLKFTDPKALSRFLSVLDKQGVVSVSFGELKNADMPRYDREGSIAALNNAKDKAQIICEAYDMSLGVPLTVNDMSNSYITVSNSPRMFKAAGMVTEDAAFDFGSSSPEALDTFPLINKTYTVSVEFAAYPNQTAD